MTPEWLLESGQLRLRTASGRLTGVSASDVVRVEHKGLQFVGDQPVRSKPSDWITNTTFNRFPLEPWLVVHAPTPGERATCRIVLRNKERSIEVDSQSGHGDQIVVGSIWFPIAEGLLAEIEQLLVDADITPGTITIRGYLHLLKSGSPQILVEDRQEKTGDTAPDNVPAAPPLFVGKLYPYQLKGVRWLRRLAEEELGGILADEMGLGKTVQVIATLAERQGSELDLIIVPATLLENWRREFEKFAPELKVLIHRGNLRAGISSGFYGYDVVLTSYETAVSDRYLLDSVSWRFMVLDEAQAIKNPQTRRTTAIRTIPKRVGVAVTGTPVENRLEDVWSILDVCCPDVLGSLESFRDQFDNTVADALLLEPRISPFILRRCVADELNDLPPRIDVPVALELSSGDSAHYERIRQSVTADDRGAAALAVIGKLRQFCTHPFVLEPASGDPVDYSTKYARFIEIVSEIIAGQQKAVVFTSYLAMVDLATTDLEARYQIPCFWLDGRVPVASRQSVVDRFSSVEGPAVLVTNPRVGGTGLNIVCANHAIHYNLEWNPAIEDQASARVYRRGQEMPVTVHRLFYASTVEELIDIRVAHKRELAGTALVPTKHGGSFDIGEALGLSPVRGE